MAKKPKNDSALKVPVRRMTERLYAEFKKELISTNIPVFKSIANDKDLLAHYFYARDMYIEILGTTMNLFDRIMRSSFATIVTKDVCTSFLENPNMILPGMWDEFHIKSLAIMSINISGIAGDENGAMYLSIRRHPDGAPDKETADSYNPATWMPFLSYHPNRIYQFMKGVQQTIMTAIVNEIDSSIPAVALTVNGEPATIRYGRQFGELMHSTFEKADKLEEGVDMDTEAKHFIKLIEEPLMTYTTVLLSESGFNVDMIPDMIKRSRATATYTTESRTGKKAGKFIHQWTKIYYTLLADEIPGLMAKCEICPMDVKIAADAMNHPVKELDEETGEEKTLPPILTTDERNACNRLGKSIINFIDSMSAYMINMSIFDNNTKVEAEIAAMNAASAEESTEESDT